MGGIIMKSVSETIDRQMAVAGKFYPASTAKLQLELEMMFASAVPKRCHNVRAIICPHAGYIYSGEVAASAFNQIDGKAAYKRIFIIGSSHQVSFEGAAVYCDGDFIMPYGKEKVDKDLGKMLVTSYPKYFTDDHGPHTNEHCVEVQLPILHHVLKADYKIVPIVIGTSDKTICKEIASVLKPYLTQENLFIISSDFSHYPNYADAQKVDFATKEAIVANDPELLINTLRKNGEKRIPHLVTSLCGWTSVLTLLYMTSDNKSLKYRAIDYKNSGDTEYYGEKGSVVGYWGIAVSEKSTSGPNFHLSPTEKAALLNIARDSIESVILSGKKSKLSPDDYSAALKTKCGAFVTIHNKGQLRGCIGRMTGEIPLYKMIQEMAVSAALYDYRFLPMEKEELPDIEVEISVLSPLKKIMDIDEIELGKHGIYIEKGGESGVFLPQVAKETGWTKEEFLGHCSRDKAGLGWNGWKTANIYIFTAAVFH